MSAGANASAGDVNIRGVGVSGEDHGAGSVEDSVVGVGGEVVEELTEVGLGELGGCGLCGSKVAEGNKEIVVYCATIIQEGAYNGLDLFDTGVVEFGAGVRQVGEFLFDAINDGYVAKGRVLRFRWDGVAPFKEEVFNVILYRKATGAFGVVPGEINAGKSGARPVLGDFIMPEEDVAKVIGVAFVDVFYAEVVND